MAITDDERKRRDREKHNKLWREDPGYRDRSLQYKAKRYAANPEPAKAYAAEWRAAHPGYNLSKARSSRYRRTYGVSPKDYDDMFAAQGGSCAICGREQFDSSKRRLEIDHDHATNKARGFLTCGACNRGMGQFGDDPRLLRQAALYLELHDAQA